MEKPLPPTDSECCDSACEPCVWDVFYAEMAKWKSFEKTQSQATLDPKEAQDD